MHSLRISYNTLITEDRLQVDKSIWHRLEMERVPTCPVGGVEATSPHRAVRTEYDDNLIGAAEDWGWDLVAACSVHQYR